MPSPKCMPGCDGACGNKHRKRCPDGCTCKRHDAVPCPVGCTCPRHVSRPRLTDEERAASLVRKRERDRLHMQTRYRTDPAYVESIRLKNATKGRGYAIKSKYGITLEQWDDLHESQDGRCYLCGDRLPGDSDVCIDHDHGCCSGKRSCGRCIRGLACRWCNQGLGQFRDDPARMRHAADALEKAQARIAITPSRQ